MTPRSLTIAMMLACLLSSCSVVKPIGSFELNHALEGATDFWQHSDRDYQCDQPQVRVEVGGETRSGWSAGVYHESMLFCGQYNTKPEIYENGLYLKKTWGGWRDKIQPLHLE